MTDPSLTEQITNVTNPDMIMLAAGLGGFLMWVWWYRKGAETDYLYKIYQTNKKIRLGLYVSVAIGLLTGSALGIYGNTKGWDPNTTAVGAFFAGLFGTWLLKGILNRFYTTACQIAQHPFFADNIKSLMPQHSQEILPPQRYVGKGLASTMEVTPVPRSVGEWKQQRATITEQLLILFNRGAINREEMQYMHNLLPEVVDLETIQHDTLQLMHQQQNLTIGEKTDLINIILTQQGQIQRQSELIDIQQNRLERAGLTMQPQNRLPRELLFAAAGALGRHVIGWFL